MARPVGGVAWLLLVNAHGIPLLSRTIGLEAPALATQGLVDSLYSAATVAGAQIGSVASEVRD